MTNPIPIIFEPILKAKVWGGRRLEHWGKALPEGQSIGESWELADLAQTSAGGGGGDAARSVVASGRHKGRTLHELMDEWGEGLLGGASRSAEGGFPLLVKFLDAREHLSVQVHPSPLHAEAHADAHLKTESWLVLEAEPGSVIYKGFKPGTTPEALRAALTGDGRGVVELLETVPAVPGDCHTLPSGTVHALGAGVLVAEVQTPSDTTFRVYDWAAEYGRAGRELHVDAALACASFDAPPAPIRREAAAPTGELARTEFFVLTEHEAAAGGSVEFETHGACVVMATGGACVLLGSDDAVSLERGQTALIPAACAGAWTLTPAADDTTRVLTAMIPSS